MPKPLPLGATATTAASGGNREELLGPRPAGCKRQRSRRWEPQPGQWQRVSADGEGKPGTKEPLRSDKHWLLIESSYRCIFVLSQHPCPLSRACARQLPQRGSHWQAGPLPTGCPRPDMAQKGGPCYRGQRLLDKRTLSSCRWPRQRSTTVPETSCFACPA